MSEFSLCLFENFADTQNEQLQFLAFSAAELSIGRKDDSQCIDFQFVSDSNSRPCEKVESSCQTSVSCNSEESFIGGYLNLASADRVYKRDYWTRDYADYLLALKQYNKYSYVEIAERINSKFGTSRDSKCVQYRWTRVYNPVLKKGGFDEAEKAEIRRLWELYDGNVKTIKKQVPHRTFVQIQHLCRQFK